MKRTIGFDKPKTYEDQVKIYQILGDLTGHKSGIMIAIDETEDELIFSWIER